MLRLRAALREFFPAALQAFDDLASTEARYGFVFARRGLNPEAASSWFLPHLVGVQPAREAIHLLVMVSLRLRSTTVKSAS